MFPQRDNNSGTLAPDPFSPTIHSEQPKDPPETCFSSPRDTTVYKCLTAILGKSGEFSPRLEATDRPANLPPVKSPPRMRIETEQCTPQQNVLQSAELIMSLLYTQSSCGSCSSSCGGGPSMATRPVKTTTQIGRKTPRMSQGGVIQILAIRWQLSEHITTICRIPLQYAP